MLLRVSIGGRPASCATDENESPRMIAYERPPTKVLKRTVSPGRREVPSPKVLAHVSLSAARGQKEGASVETSHKSGARSKLRHNSWVAKWRLRKWVGVLTGCSAGLVANARDERKRVAGGGAEEEEHGQCGQHAHRRRRERRNTTRKSKDARANDVLGQVDDGGRHCATLRVGCRSRSHQRHSRTRPRTQLRLTSVCRACKTWRRLEVAPRLGQQSRTSRALLAGDQRECGIAREEQDCRSRDKAVGDAGWHDNGLLSPSQCVPEGFLRVEGFPRVKTAHEATTPDEPPGPESSVTNETQPAHKSREVCVLSRSRCDYGSGGSASGASEPAMRGLGPAARWGAHRVCHLLPRRARRNSTTPLHSTCTCWR